jgi:hypothetical protein
MSEIEEVNDSHASALLTAASASALGPRNVLWWACWYGRAGRAREAVDAFACQGCMTLGVESEAWPDASDELCGLKLRLIGLSLYGFASGVSRTYSLMTVRLRHVSSAARTLGTMGGGEADDSRVEVDARPLEESEVGASEAGVERKHEVRLARL